MSYVTVDIYLTVGLCCFGLAITRPMDFEIFGVPYLIGLMYSMSLALTGGG